MCIEGCGICDCSHRVHAHIKAKQHAEVQMRAPAEPLPALLQCKLCLVASAAHHQSTVPSPVSPYLQATAFPFLWHGGARIFLRVLPFSLWKFYAAIGTGMEEHANQFFQVCAEQPLANPASCKPEMRWVRLCLHEHMCTCGPCSCLQHQQV